VLHQWGFDGDGRLSEVRGCTKEDLRLLDSDLMPIDIERKGLFLFGRSAASALGKLPDVLAACRTLIGRFSLDLPLEAPTPMAEDGQTLGSDAAISRHQIGGQDYWLVRLRAPKLAVVDSLRCWIFKTEAADAEHDGAAIAALKASLSPADTPA
jgi:hypothetical protein